MSSSTESLSTAHQPPGFVGMRLLLHYLSPRLPLVSLLSLALLGGIAVQLTNPQIIRVFIDTAQSRGPQRALLSAAAWYIGLSLAGQALTLVASTLAESLSWASTNDLRRDLALHCLQLDLSFHNRHTPGELLERIDGDTTALANFLSSFVIQVIGNGVLLAGILALLFREDLRVGWSLTLFTLAALLLLSAIQRLAVGRWASERQASANLFGYLEERIAGAEDLRASGAGGYALRRLDGLARILVSKSRSAFVVSSLASSLTDLLFALGYAAALALGAYLYTQGRFSLGAAYLVVTYVGMLAEPLQRIRLQWQDYQQAVASIQRIQELMAIQPRVRDATGADVNLVENHAVPQVEFNQVSFRYNDQNPADEGCAPDVLSEVNFTLRSGQVLGILGRTGSGKTTLTRLLFRLYDPTQGQVCLDGTDLRQMSRASLHHQVGMVTQEVQIFQASLRDNIAFFNPRITDRQILEALHEMGLEAWFNRLPAGLDSRLEPGGSGMSAGEAQLLAFARLLLKDPGLVILDEASSRLDPATEARLEKAIDRLFLNRTGILVAHRLRTIQRADHLLILQGGRVLEAGPRLALAADPASHFSGLLQTGLEEVLT